MIVFDGYAAAQRRELLLGQRVTQLLESGTKRPHIAAILFAEDTGSQLYTRLKREAAERVGIGYTVYEFSLAHPNTDALSDLLSRLNLDEHITGIIIQKPWRSTWLTITGRQKNEFSTWWHGLTAHIDVRKDVDGLHPSTLEAIRNGSWHQEHRVLPATCAAVLSILQNASTQLGWGSELWSALQGKEIAILGKSDLLGLPLSYELHNHGTNVHVYTSQEFEARAQAGTWLHDADIVVSATGRTHLITGAAVKEGAVIIDVGEPRPDVERATVEPRAAFLTPVPGGVGPMTVVSLLENACDILRSK